MSVSSVPLTKKKSVDYILIVQMLTSTTNTQDIHKRELKWEKKVFLVHFSSKRLRPFPLMEGLSKCKLFKFIHTREHIKTSA